MGAVGLAVYVQAFEITGSPATLGILGLVSFLAMIVGVVLGAAVVDHVERRRLLLWTQAGFGLGVTALMISSLLGEPPIVLLYFSSASGALVASLHFPTRSAMIPPVVRDDHLTTAMTLEMVVWNVTMIMGPIVGGVVVDRWGYVAVYGLTLACYAIAIALLMPLERQPSIHAGEETLGVAAIRHGFAYLRPRPVLRALLWVDLIAMGFGMRRALFPVLAVEQFDRGPEVVGLLMAAIPAGALVVSLMGDWISRVYRQGLGVVVASAGWGAAIALFGLSGDHLWIALTLLAIGGGVDIVAAILRGTIIQHEVPGPVRGRVWGINFLVLNGGPRLGDFTGGLAASAWGATFSVVAGGLAALVGTGLYGLAAPELPRYVRGDGVDPIEEPCTRGEDVSEVSC